jgi:hypothetical protein
MSNIPQRKQKATTVALEIAIHYPWCTVREPYRDGVFYEYLRFGWFETFRTAHTVHIVHRRATYRGN